MMKKDYRSWILYGLLIIHTYWIGTHMCLVANGKINPWKMGGYGMYTGPSPRPSLKVYQENSDGEFKKIPREQLRLYRYKQANYHYNFYCKTVTPDELNIFLEDNPQFVGKNINLKVKGQFMTTKPIERVIKTISTIRVRWKNSTQYNYQMEYCQDKIHEDSGQYPS